MIVFTASHRPSQSVFVGKAQESVEEAWAQLLDQAAAGVEGIFFDYLRVDARDFTVETWGYAETPAEVRECFNEARNDLGAEVIKAPRSKPSNTEPLRSASMKALMETIREAAEADPDADLLEASETSQQGKKEDAAQSAIETKVSATTAATDADRNAMSVDARIEAMKAAQAKILKNKPQQSTQVIAKTLVSKKVASKKPGAKQGRLAPDKLATGRTSSSTKEKRIRETIEQEREIREQSRAERGRAEQAEMNALMARVEMRRQAHKEKKKEESKKRAAAAAKARKAAEKQQQADKAQSLVGRSVATNTALPAESVSTQDVQPNPASAVASVDNDVVSSTAITATPSAKALKPAQPLVEEPSKEERLKQAMAKQRAERAALRRSQRSQEGDEMSRLLARLDARTDGGRERRRRG